MHEITQKNLDSLNNLRTKAIHAYFGVLFRRNYLYYIFMLIFDLVMYYVAGPDIASVVINFIALTVYAMFKMPENKEFLKLMDEMAKIEERIRKYQ